MSYYKKPKDLTYTDMAIWIDNNDYREDLTEKEKNQVFEYLYHLAYMLARNGRYFRSNEDYENFAISLASRIYFRIYNDKCKYDESKKLKSCLNYMKSIINLARIDYQQENYAQIISREEQVLCPEYSIVDRLSSTVNDLSYVNFNWYLETIEGTIKHFINQLPFSGNKVTKSRIYISCLLSLLNMITIKKSKWNKIWGLSLREDLKLGMVEKQFDKQSTQDYIILYHLDESMRGYIYVLINELKHIIANELSLLLHTQITAESSIDVLAFSELNNEELEEEY